MTPLTNKEITKIIRRKLGMLYEKGFTKYDIAAELNVSIKAIYKWENGTMPKANQLLNLDLLCEENCAR